MFRNLIFLLVLQIVYGSKSYAFLRCGTAEHFCTLSYIGEKYVLPTMPGGILFFSLYILFFVFRMFRSSALSKSCCAATTFGLRSAEHGLKNVPQCSAHVPRHSGIPSNSPESSSPGRAITTHSVRTPPTLLHLVYLRPLTSIKPLDFR